MVNSFFILFALKLSGNESGKKNFITLELAGIASVISCTESGGMSYS